MTAPVSLADVRLAHDGMTQHECARVGCTRNTSTQECDIHAAEPAGVIHEAKEPRPTPTRVSFLHLTEAAHAAISEYEFARARADGHPFTRAVDLAKTSGAAITALLAAFDSIAAERDEWKRRAEALGYQGGR